ncbi:MAG: hypothetical protein ACI9OJ_005165 [Myxococcota bacterium]|jgi:hypothetical protein
MSGPSKVFFLTIHNPGTSVRLTWARPSHTVCGYTVLSTDNPFPPDMAPALFEGKLTAFINEQTLGPEASGVQVDNADKYYAVLVMDGRGDWRQVIDVRQAEAAEGVPLAVTSIEVTQPRTLARVRWSPPTGPNEQAVYIYMRADCPNEDALAAMLSGVTQPDAVLSASADGFIDNRHDAGYRNHFVALAMDLKGRPRPLRLNDGAIESLKRPALLDPANTARVDALNAALCAQVDEAIRRRSSTIEEVRAILHRALDLAPGHPSLLTLAQVAQSRWPDFNETVP